MNKLQEFLQKPFPLEESKAQLFKIITAISIFVVVFLYLFKPFGLHTLEPKLLLYCVGFGLVSWVASLLYEFGVVPILKIKNEANAFTFGRWILYFCGAMLFISLANFIFIRLLYFGDIQWSLFPYMIRGVFAIGLFPVVLMGALALLKQEQKYSKIAAEVNQGQASRQADEGVTENVICEIPVDQIRYIEAMQNYIKIGHVSTNAQMSEKVVRETLKNILEVTNHNLVRCHRSYLVNRDSILSATGNAQGLLLTLSDCEKEIPVSRSFVSVFRQ